MIGRRAIAVAAGIACCPTGAAAASVLACMAGPAELTLRSDTPADPDAVRYHGLAGQVRLGGKPVPLCAGTRYRIMPVRRPCTVVVPARGTVASIRDSIARQAARHRGCPLPIVSVAGDGPGHDGNLFARRIVPGGKIDTRYRREILVVVDSTPPPCCTASVPRRAPKLTGMDFDAARRAARKAGFADLVAVRDGAAVEATGGDLVAWQYPAANAPTAADSVVVEAKRPARTGGKCMVGPVTEDQTTTLAGLERAYRPSDPRCRPVKATLVANGRLLDREGLDTEAWTVTATSPSRTATFDAATETPLWIVRRTRAVVAPDLLRGTVLDATRTIEAIGLPPPLVLAGDRLVAATDTAAGIVAEQLPAAGQPVTERIVVRVPAAGPAGDAPPVPAILAAGGGVGIAGGELVRRMARRPREGRTNRRRDGESAASGAKLAAVNDPLSWRVRARPDLPLPVTLDGPAA